MIACVSNAQQIQGKPLSYNNIADSDAAFECVKQFTQPACVIVKHASPCGVATAESVYAAYRRAYASDPVSAFGGIIAFNQTLDADTAQEIIQQQFVEVIIAPEITTQAQEIFANKPNVRLLHCPNQVMQISPYQHMQRINHGLLVQDADTLIEDPQQWQCVSEQLPTTQQMQDLMFAWQVVKYAKSNAICLAHQQRILGIGSGQPNRVDCVRIALEKATRFSHDTASAVLASDAFFPFADSIEIAAKAGVKAIIQPGGSKRDNEVIAMANQYQIAMLFTGIRHFRH
jgi:phosphoribosylaminoimidazolecarboxamide formyltransferase/IMP cyclohydrolase